MTQPDQTPVRDELAAMRRITNVLDSLDPATRGRIVGWLFDRYRIVDQEADRA